MNWFHFGGTFLFCAGMILIYSHISTARLQYICSFIFKEVMGIDFKLTIDSDKFKGHTGPKINYSDSKFSQDEFYVGNSPLLFERGIKPQQINCFVTNGNHAFFKTESGDFPFDILAAAFYLLSRYEEYLPHEKDMYGRYDYINSIANKENFLNLPLINIWVLQLAVALKLKFSGLQLQLPTFNFQPTYDIDIAYAIKHKGLLRNIGGFLKSPSAERIKVLAGNKEDPFDCYDWLHQFHQQNNLQPVFFFLATHANGKYDKNILPHKDAMWKLVKQHAKKYEIGLHPSWQSGDDKSLVKKEKEQLETMAETRINKSRQHYIRFNLPQSYSRLIEAGITNDYSMGYGSINGFRASVASSFYWYNLEKEEQTLLRLHPFCFMDANSFYEQKQDTKQTAEELNHYLRVCKQVNGILITIWHNNFLGTASEFKGWRETYEEFIAQVLQ